MVASIKPQRDELGLSDGLMLIDGTWSAAQDGKTWDHSHPATGEQVASFPVAGTVPLGRLVTPDEVADACLFLASPLAASISGASLLLHGGGERPA